MHEDDLDPAAIRYLEALLELSAGDPDKKVRDAFVRSRAGLSAERAGPLREQLKDEGLLLEPYESLLSITERGKAHLQGRSGTMARVKRSRLHRFLAGLDDVLGPFGGLRSARGMIVGAVAIVGLIAGLGVRSCGH